MIRGLRHGRTFLAQTLLVLCLLALSIQVALPKGVMLAPHPETGVVQLIPCPGNLPRLLQVQRAGPAKDHAHHQALSRHAHQSGHVDPHHGMTHGGHGDARHGDIPHNATDAHKQAACPVAAVSLAGALLLETHDLLVPPAKPARISQPAAPVANALARSRHAPPRAPPYSA